jgi:hypothetical protein
VRIDRRKELRQWEGREGEREIIGGRNNNHHKKI